MLPRPRPALELLALIAIACTLDAEHPIVAAADVPSVLGIARSTDGATIFDADGDRAVSYRNAES